MPIHARTRQPQVSMRSGPSPPIAAPGHGQAIHAKHGRTRPAPRAARRLLMEQSYPADGTASCARSARRHSAQRSLVHRRATSSGFMAERRNTGCVNHPAPVGLTDGHLCASVAGCGQGERLLPPAQGVPYPSLPAPTRRRAPRWRSKPDTNFMELTKNGEILFLRKFCLCVERALPFCFFL